MPLWIFYMFLSTFGVPVFAIWGLWFLYQAILAAGRSETARKATEAVSGATVDVGEVAEREKARRALRTQLNQDLDFLARERRTGGITNEQYAERVAATKRRAEMAFDQVERVGR